MARVQASPGTAPGDHTGGARLRLVGDHSVVWRCPRAPSKASSSRAERRATRSGSPSKASRGGSSGTARRAWAGERRAGRGRGRHRPGRPKARQRQVLHTTHEGWGGEAYGTGPSTASRSPQAGPGTRGSARWSTTCRRAPIRQRQARSVARWREQALRLACTGPLNATAADGCPAYRRASLVSQRRRPGRRPVVHRPGAARRRGSTLCSSEHRRALFCKGAHWSRGGGAAARTRACGAGGAGVRGPRSSR